MKRIKYMAIVFLSAAVLSLISYPEIKKEEIEIKIGRGSNLEKISEILHENNIIKDKPGFKIMTILDGSSSELSFGWYRMEKYSNPRKILTMLKKGQRMTVKVTIPEGLSSSQTINLIGQNCDVDIKELYGLLNDRQFLDDLGVKSGNPEGYLFPDTYIFYRSEEPRSIIKRMINRLNSVLKHDRLYRIDTMSFTSHQILTIASMIEREAVIEREKPLIASVIYNRLKKGMKLQIDATILYSLGYHKPRIYFKDLKVDSPYNTYKHRGLPPGPIANPGYQSILAAIHPADTDYLYYVADGKGGHIFTDNFSEHKEAKRKARKNW